MLVLWMEAVTDQQAVDATVKYAINCTSYKPEYRVEYFNGELYIPQKEETVLAFGAGCLDLLKANGVVPKNRALGSLRGTVFPKGEGVYLTTYNPGIIWIDESKPEEIIWDTVLALRYDKYGTLLPQVGEYRYVEDFTDIVSYIEKEFAKTGKPVDVATDTETVGFYPWYPDKHIVSIQVSVTPGMADVKTFKDVKDTPKGKLREQIVFLLTSPKVSHKGANFKFDLLWILVKWGIECTNFKMDTLLAGSLVNENRSNSLNSHAKIYTSFGGYDDCVTPDTRICTDDLRWVPISSVKAGDKLVGFDEDVPAPRTRRRLRIAEAVSTKRLVKPCLKITFSDGRVIKCSTDHRFLAYECQTNNGPFVWVAANALKEGNRVQLGMPVEQQCDSFEAGYVSGLYDGEGFVETNSKGIRSGITQQPGLVWDKYSSIMDTFGLGGFYAKAKNTDGCMTSKHQGWQTLRLLQLFRPVRLLAKNTYDGKCIPSGGLDLFVTSIEDLGDTEVVSLQTSTHTFIAEGVCSHNCFNAKHDKSRMDLALEKDPKNFLVYAGGDTDACLQVSTKVRQELRQAPSLQRFYTKLLHPAARAFEKIEERGILVDKKKYLDLRVKVVREIDRLHEEMLAMMPQRLKLKYKDNLNLTRAQILSDYLFTSIGLGLKPKMITERTGKPSTAKEHFEMFFDVPEAKEFTKLYEEWNSARKTLTAYIDGFLEHLRPDGKFHPTYFLFKGASFEEDTQGGTLTGRTSAKNPAIQTLTKHNKWAKPLRECFIAPPGHVCFQVDFSQGELKIAACLANEPRMIDAYSKGLDLHAVTASGLAGIPFDEFMSWKGNEDKTLADKFDAIRQRGKAGNFGMIYGIGAEGYTVYARKNYKVILSLAQAEKDISSFFETYSALKPWHDSYIAYAHRHKNVPSPLGRLRHLPLIKSRNSAVRSQAGRQAINSPVQSTLSDMMLWAISYIERELAPKGVLITGMTHDSTNGYLPQDKAVDLLKSVLDIMENLPFEETFGWKPQLKFTADAEIGINMAELKKLKV